MSFKDRARRPRAALRMKGNADKYAKMEPALEFQDFVTTQLYGRGIVLVGHASFKQQLVGENAFGMEIKFDQQVVSRPGLWIEIAEKSRASNATFVPSGIYKPDSTWLYLQGNYAAFWIFGLKTLRKVAAKFGKPETIPTAKGLVITRELADEHCSLRWDTHAGWSLGELAGAEVPAVGSEP